MKTDVEVRLGEILDSEWVRSLFHTPNVTDAEEIHRITTLRYQTTADTSLGGSGIGNSRVLNPPPGINRFADTPRGFGANGGVDGLNEGNGVYHHELLEKPMDIVHFRPGIARVNPAMDFWTSAFNTDVVEAMEYGWVRKMAKFAGEVLGFFIKAPLMAVGGIFKTLRSLILGPNANKYNFYYLSPAPFLFWKGLDDMVTTFAVKIGFTGSARYSDTKISAEGALPHETNGSMEDMVGLLPGIFSELDMTGGYRIDTITLAHRYNMMEEMRADFLKVKSKELLGKTFTTEKEYYNAIASWEDALRTAPDKYMGGKSVESKLAAARNTLKELNAFQSDSDRYTAIMGGTTWKGEAQARKSNLQFDIDEDGVVKTEEEVDQGLVDIVPPVGGMEYGDPTGKAKLTGFQDKYKSIAIGGLDFFSLAVDKVENGSISINNSVGPSSIESMFNGTVSASKSAWFSASNGNISDGVVGGAIESAVGTAGAFVNGMVGQITGGIQSALFGGKAYIDIADVYQNSTTSMPTMSYSFTSQAISAHPISKIKMMLPVLAILRVASPISGGPRSFMSPYLLNVTHKGRAVCQMGLVTSCTLDWGDEAGWDINDLPCEIGCKFEVTNLDKSFHIPLTGEFTDIYNDDGSYDALTNILAGVSPTDLDRSWAYNIKTNWARAVSKADRFFSSSHMAFAAGVGTRRLFEGPISFMGGYVQWRE